MYETMVLIREFEESLIQPLLNHEIKCPVHLYTGQEAIAVGVCANLTSHDAVFSTHRSHGHYLAKGGSPKTLMAELYGKKTGCSRGYGGSMHLANPAIGLYGSSAIVAGSIPLAVGAALTFKTTGKRNVAVAFFGDGATNEGTFYESLNLASLYKLPVLFVCENNKYSTHMPIEKCLADINIHKKAKCFSMPSCRIDGNNVLEVYDTTRKAINHARQGKGPSFIECLTYRHHGHVGPHNDLDKGLRNKEQYDYWLSQDPITQYEKILLNREILTLAQKSIIQLDVISKINEAFDYAKESPMP